MTLYSYWNISKSRGHLFWQVLTSTYFLCEGKFYAQTDGIAMGSPLVQTAERTVQHKLTHWFRYVEDARQKMNFRNFCYFSTASTRILNLLLTLRTTAHCHFWMCW
jgi:hypothetical protein